MRRTGIGTCAAAIALTLTVGGVTQPTFAAAGEPGANDDSPTATETPTETATPTAKPTEEPTPSPAPASTSASASPSKTPSKSPSKPSKTPSKSPSPSPSSSDDKKKKKKDKDKDPEAVQAKTWAEQGLEHLIAGIDVSLWQHTENEVIDWKTVRKAGVRWVYSKCSDGPGTPGEYDKWGPLDVVGAQQAGLIAGCYHYGQPGMGSPDLHESARIQAQVAVSKLPDEMKTRLPLALDIEETGDLSSEDIAEWTFTFLEEAEKLTGRTPWIYASSTFLLQHMPTDKRLKRFPVWVAGWGVDRKDVLPDVPEWAKVVAWQFTSTGVVAGVPNPIVDLNVFVKDNKAFKKYTPTLAKLAAAETPPPAPIVFPMVPRAEVVAELLEQDVQCAQESLATAFSMGAIPHIAPRLGECAE